ncbi:uncharacterized protein [Haliotis cracherodii]|uniref:uncharacterized protein n=1 Tax=Haliotis cracherodii TaxID=6455 RepID=UPI0039EA96D0
MAEEKWTGTIQQYMATENIHVDKLLGYIPKNCFYYIFVELVEDVILTDTEKELLGTCLASCHEDYGEIVAYGGVLEPVVLQMERGTFEGVRRLILSVNPEASSVQYKPAKFIRKPEVLNYLLKHHMK